MQTDSAPTMSDSTMEKRSARSPMSIIYAVAQRQVRSTLMYCISAFQKRKSSTATTSHSMHGMMRTATPIRS